MLSAMGHMLKNSCMETARMFYSKQRSSMVSSILKNVDYFSSNMVVAGRWLRPNTELLSTCVLTSNLKNSLLNVSGRQNARGGCGAC